MQNEIFWSEIASGFGEPGGTPPPRIPRSTPPEAAINLEYFFLLWIKGLTDDVTRGLGIRVSHSWLRAWSQEFSTFSKKAAVLLGRGTKSKDRFSNYK